MVMVVSFVLTVGLVPGVLVQGAASVGELADGAVIDSRVLLADRFGSDEATWPPAADRFASDLLRPDGIADDWLRRLTTSAATSERPILMGAHTLVGPGVRLLLGRGNATNAQRAALGRG